MIVVLLSAFLSTLGLLVLLIGLGSPWWAITVLAVFAAVEAVALLLSWKDKHRGRQ